MAEYVKLILDELLRYRLSSEIATKGFKNLRHNDDLCPLIERQINTYLDCSLKYRRVAYDVQGPRDKGSDIVLRHGQDDDMRYIVIQVKSYHDLKEREYLSKLKAQAFEVRTEYGDRLDHFFILLCADVLEQANQLRNIRKDFATAAQTTVVDPTYVWTFLRLTPLAIDAVVEAILKQEDAVYGRARSFVVDTSPLQTAVLMCLLARFLESGALDVPLEELRSMAFLELALQRIPDIDYSEFFEDEEWDPEELDEEWGEFPHDEPEPQVDRRRDSNTRIAEAIDAMDSDSVSADPLSDVVSIDFAACEPLIALFLDAKVRYGYEGSELARYVFEALKVSRIYKLDFDDQMDQGAS